MVWHSLGCHALSASLPTALGFALWGRCLLFNAKIWNILHYPFQEVQHVIAIDSSFPVTACTVPPWPCAGLRGQSIKAQTKRTGGMLGHEGSHRCAGLSAHAFLEDASEAAFSMRCLINNSVARPAHKQQLAVRHENRLVPLMLPPLRAYITPSATIESTHLQGLGTPVQSCRCHHQLASSSSPEQLKDAWTSCASFLMGKMAIQQRVLPSGLVPARTRQVQQRGGINTKAKLTYVPTGWRFTPATDMIDHAWTNSDGPSWTPNALACDC